MVLSGGGARGFAHIGVLQALEGRGITVDAIAGTSMGAVLAALYAADHDADGLYELARGVSWRDVADVSLHTSLLKGEKLAEFLAEHLPERFDELRRPLAVTTTDVETGEEVVLLAGPLRVAVRASACFPGAFEPVEHQGHTLVDGGVVNNLPVSAAAFLDAQRVIASDATPPRRSAFRRDEGGSWWDRMVATVRLERRSPMIQMLLRSSDIMQAMLTDLQHTLHPSDLRIVHEMPEVRVESFRELERAVELGRANAERALDRWERERPGLLERPAAPPGGRR